MIIYNPLRNFQLSCIYRAHGAGGIYTAFWGRHHKIYPVQLDHVMFSFSSSILARLSYNSLFARGKTSESSKLATNLASLPMHSFSTEDCTCPMY
jgi:hypothetical protein